MLTNRIYFDKDEGAGQGAGTPPSNGAPENGDDDFDKPRAMATINKLRQIEKEHQKLLKATEERDRADAEREAEWLREQGDFKTLSEKQGTELAQTKAELSSTSAYKAAFQAALDARIKAIPEAMRSLVPEGMEPIALSTWLDKNAALLMSRPAPNLDPGASSNVGGAPQIEVDAVEAETAHKMGYTIDQYRKVKAKYGTPST